jgi:hypothetical protein
METTPEITPEATAAATPNFYITVTTPSGEPARIERMMTAGDLAIVFLLIVLIVSVWGFYLSPRLGGKRDR